MTTTYDVLIASSAFRENITRAYRAVDERYHAYDRPLAPTDADIFDFNLDDEAAAPNLHCVVLIALHRVRKELDATSNKTTIDLLRDTTVCLAELVRRKTSAIDPATNRRMRKIGGLLLCVASECGPVYYDAVQNLMSVAGAFMLAWLNYDVFSEASDRVEVDSYIHEKRSLVRDIVCAPAEDGPLRSQISIWMIENAVDHSFFHDSSDDDDDDTESTLPPAPHNIWRRAGESALTTAIERAVSFTRDTGRICNLGRIEALVRAMDSQFRARRWNAETIIGVVESITDRGYFPSFIVKTPLRAVQQMILITVLVSVLSDNHILRGTRRIIHSTQREPVWCFIHNNFPFVARHYLLPA